MQSLSKGLLAKSIIHINGKLGANERMTDRELIMKRVKKTLSKINDLDFSKINEEDRKCEKYINNKKRTIRRYWPFESENIISVYLKFVLDKQFNIKYPNRRKIIKELINTLYLIKDYTTFTIYKFDFKDFFDNISACDVYYRMISGSLRRRKEEDILRDYCESVKSCIQGLPLSNCISEIAGSKFDKVIAKTFADKKVIYYHRYVDDCILILNQHIDYNKLNKVVTDVIHKVFNKEVTLNPEKEKYISSLQLRSSMQDELEYLGYLFTLNNKNSQIKIQYGIAESKIQKYKKIIEQIVDSYIIDENVELLRHRLKCFCRRVVTMDSIGNTCHWKSKGIIASYEELRFHIDDIDARTKEFLMRGVIQAFLDRKINKFPYFFRTHYTHKNENPSSKIACNCMLSPYNLYNSLRKNSAIIFVSNRSIGIESKRLISMCKQINVVPVFQNGTLCYKETVEKYMSALKNVNKS